jgi:translocator protein
MHMGRQPSFSQYALWMFLCQGVGIVGSYITIGEIPAWYASLALPTWQPPNWVFGPVWTMLYLLMGIAGARIWFATERSDVLRRLFIAQLFLNVLWTPVFFGAHSLLGALVIIFALDSVVAILLRRLWHREHPSFLCLMPYFVWVLFATCLNAAILALNS